MSDQLRDFVKKCLVFEPSQRYNIYELKKAKSINHVKKVSDDSVRTTIITNQNNIKQNIIVNLNGSYNKNNTMNKNIKVLNFLDAMHTNSSKKICAFSDGNGYYVKDFNIPISDKVKQITVTTTMSETGNYYVYVYDMQDNLTTKAIYVDLDAPVVTYQISGTNVSYTISDNGTLKGYKVTSSSTFPSDYTSINVKEYSVSFTKQSGTNYYIHAIDKKNNTVSVRVV